MEKECELFWEHIYSLHKENSIFLNKALLSIPAILIAVLLNFFGNFQNSCSKIFLFLACIIFLISTMLMIFSFFKAISMLDGLLEKKNTQKMAANSARNINFIVSVFIFFGLLFSVIAIYLEYIL